MIYLKTELNGEKEKVDVYGDEFYCECPGCGKEVHLDSELLKIIVNDGCDFGGTTFYCRKCAEEKEGSAIINQFAPIYDLIKKIENKKVASEFDIRLTAFMSELDVQLDKEEN